MHEVVASTRVNAPPDRVFDVFTDFENAPENVRGIKALELLTPGPLKKGSRFRQTRVISGHEETEEMEVTDFRPGESYSVGGESHGARYAGTMKVSPDGKGSKVEMRFTFTPISVFAKLMGFMAQGMVDSFKKALQQDLEDLKKVAEDDDADAKRPGEKVMRAGGGRRASDRAGK